MTSIAGTKILKKIDKTKQTGYNDISGLVG
jgi:hypothetical protein